MMVTIILLNSSQLQKDYSFAKLNWMWTSPNTYKFADEYTTGIHVRLEYITNHPVAALKLYTIGYINLIYLDHTMLEF